MRAKERVGGMSGKRVMYSPSRRLEFWVWAYQVSGVGVEVDLMT